MGHAQARPRERDAPSRDAVRRDEERENWSSHGVIFANLLNYNRCDLARGCWWFGRRLQRPSFAFAAARGECPQNVCRLSCVTADRGFKIAKWLTWCLGYLGYLGYFEQSRSGSSATAEDSQCVRLGIFAKSWESSDA
jgi:hypothetical protein